MRQTSLRSLAVHAAPETSCGAPAPESWEATATPGGLAGLLLLEVGGAVGRLRGCGGSTTAPAGPNQNAPKACAPSSALSSCGVKCLVGLTVRASWVR